MDSTAGMYASFKFPPYKFCEYPKWVRTKSGEQVLVTDRRTEMDVELASPPEKGEAEVSVAAERDKLARELSAAHAELAALRAERQIPGEIEPKVGPVATKKVA